MKMHTCSTQVKALVFISKKLETQVIALGILHTSACYVNEVSNAKRQRTSQLWALKLHIYAWDVPTKSLK